MLGFGKTVLAFFAHPDDETLGAGGTIHRLSDEGSRVVLAIPNTGINSRRRHQGIERRASDLSQLRNDCIKAAALLGISAADVHFGDFPDNESDKHSRLELVHWLEGVLDQVSPTAIVTHARFCTNIDHQYCHEASVIATRPSTSTHISMLCCEIPSSTGYLRPSQWEPNLHVSLSSADLEAKIAALRCYTTEMRADPHPRSPEVIRALAKIRGSEAGFDLAEAFAIQRVAL